ncbi:MAG TPA: multicopper oxidase domain-containing protein [Pyrinomonadaceae bacterium]|jgi:FtsP/CotA-like multicopper oxidase with cupredoxin domain|nr:multicopper oxidase domain-containing protein [Pyrinomonadaceae bacterium]
MAYISKRNRRQEKDRQIAAHNRRELIAAGFKRRDLLKMGLLTSAGMLIPIKGLSAHPINSAGMVFDDPVSPPTTPFQENMPRLTVAQPVASLTPAPTIAPNTAAGEGRTVSHQAFAQFPPQRFYELIQQQGTVSMALPNELPAQTIWGFNGITPGPLFVERYGVLGSPGNGSILVRQRNNLPSNNGGFGLPSVTTHLHNGHTPLESDGFPCFFFAQGQFYDYHYPNVLAGVNSTHPGTGDIKEAMSTLWYHDHRIDHTAENTYKGLAGTYILFNEFDTGDENTGFRLPSFGDGQNPLTSFDIYMVFNDKVFDEQTGLLAFDLFNTDGILGDKYLVNGKIQPVLHVSPRRYRFRWLNTGPSRFYQMFVLGPNNTTKSFWQISTDGNLLEKPVSVTSARFAVAERVDVIVDFTGQAGKTFYLENRLEQQDGRGPTGNVLSAGQGTKILQIVVDGPAVADNSIDPATIPANQAVYFYGFPNTTDTARITRTFRFERGNGQWQVNGKLANCNDIRFAIKRNTVEKWVFQNNSGGWQHPIHMHFEEFQTLTINGNPPSGTGLITRGRKDVFRLEHNMEAKVYFRFRDFVGKFPLHCHNVVHEDHAMMVLGQINDVGDNITNP